MMALPIKVAKKNFLNGTRKWPHVIPAKSNSGFGIDAPIRIVINPYFWMLSYKTILAFSMKVLSFFYRSAATSLI